MTPNPLRPPHPSAGFSLVELMIAVAIVGILTAIALPNLARQTDKAKATEAKILTSAAAKEAQIAGTPDGTMTRDHALARPKINKSYEPIPIPKE